MFQERLFPHPELERLSGNSALPTIRVITYVENGSVETNHAFLRIAVGTNLVDNYKNGETGNLAVCVDVREGCLREGRGTPEDGVGFRKLAHHPATGVAFDGLFPSLLEGGEVPRRDGRDPVPPHAVHWLGRGHHPIGARPHRSEHVVGPEQPPRHRPVQREREAAGVAPGATGSLGAAGPRRPLGLTLSWESATRGTALRASVSQRCLLLQ